MSFDTLPSTPPPDVLDAIGAAARIYDRLTADGLELHFHVEDHTGKVAVHVCDMQGNVLGPLTPGRVLDIATGRAPDRAG